MFAFCLFVVVFFFFFFFLAFFWEGGGGGTLFLFSGVVRNVLFFPMRNWLMPFVFFFAEYSPTVFCFVLSFSVFLCC